MKGSDWTMSLDGHDKLCGYQNATFPLCVYGGLDTYSGRIQFLKIWTTNSNPKIVGRHYLEYLLESGGGYRHSMTMLINLLKAYHVFL